MSMTESQKVLFNSPMTTGRLDCTKKSDSCQGKQAFLGLEKKYSLGLSISTTMDVYSTDHSPLQPSLREGICCKGKQITCHNKHHVCCDWLPFM